MLNCPLSESSIRHRFSVVLGVVILFLCPASINRKDFGLTWNKALETGGVVVGDEVIISLEVEMIRE